MAIDENGRSYNSLEHQPLRPDFFIPLVLLIALLFTMRYYNESTRIKASDHWLPLNAVISQNGIETIRENKSIRIWPKLRVSYQYHEVPYQNILLDGGFDDDRETMSSERVGLDYVHMFYPIGNTIPILIDPYSPDKARSPSYSKRSEPWLLLLPMVALWLLFVFLLYVKFVRPLLTRTDGVNRRHW